MNVYDFSFIINIEIEENLFADIAYSICDDTLFSVSNNNYEINFTREADSLNDAKLSAIDDLNKMGINDGMFKLQKEM